MAITTVQDLKNAHPGLTKLLERKARGEKNVTRNTVNVPGKGVTEFDETISDIETGDQIQQREIRHSYYPSGELDTTVQIVFDAADKLIWHREIKHYTDGRQRTVTVIK